MMVLCFYRQAEGENRWEFLSAWKDAFNAKKYPGVVVSDNVVLIQDADSAQSVIDAMDGKVILELPSSLNKRLAGGVLECNLGEIKEFFR